MENKQEKSLPESRTYTVEEIAAILDIGRTAAYKFVKEADFRIIRIGNSIRIPRNRLKQGGIVSSDNREKAPRKNVAALFYAAENNHKSEVILKDGCLSSCLKVVRKSA